MAQEGDKAEISITRRQQMFDTYRLGGNAIEVTKTVTEKRAVTDESVRLLREMEQKAHEEADRIYIWRDNVASGTVRCCIETYSGVPTLSIHYSVNGLKRVTTITPSSDEWIDWRMLPSRECMDMCYKYLVNALAKEIALQIISARKNVDAIIPEIRKSGRL